MKRKKIKKPIKLNKCPFCGGEPTWCGDDPKEPHDCDHIVCKCGVHFNNDSPKSYKAKSFKKARKIAAKLWNKRK